jgi:putative hemolysin
MITLEDILEELVGDIQDEYDRLPGNVVASGNSWIVGGGTTLARLKEISGIDLSNDLPPNGASTLSDWLIGHLGREVRRGDVLVRDRLRVVVRKVRRHKLQEAQISR